MGTVDVGITGQNRSGLGRGPDRAPTITLPKGGGALRSLDEKLAVNGANGTFDLSIPLPFSTTRSGLDGSVSLSYSSGGGNGLFGIGFRLGISSIQRRTDKRLPLYEDDADSDVFVFSGAEDLVPALYKDGTGAWLPDLIVRNPFTVRRYRPRIEGLFARTERIAVKGEAGFYWKVTTRENVVTIFGRTAAARLVDPADSTRIFKWLPEWMYDDRGNCVQYEYADENLDAVPDRVDETNRRAGIALFANKHLKRVRYGNRRPYYADSTKPFDPPPPANPEYFFLAVLDYGEHDAIAPKPDDDAANKWPCRYDPFSDCRAGFEVRTYRLCRRLLFFSTFQELDFPGDVAGSPCLVRSLDFTYRNFKFDGAPYRSEEAELLVSMRRVHYRKTAPGTYASKAFPPSEFVFQPLAWNKAVQSATPANLVQAPFGSTPPYQWADLFGEGLQGLLTEQAGQLRFKSNLGNGAFSRASLVIPRPSLAGIASGALQLQDLDADGSKQLVSRTPGLQGYFELGQDKRWKSFRSFRAMHVVDPSDPNARYIDLDGDGKPELVITEERVFRWFPSAGKLGYEAPRATPKAANANLGPAVIFADGTQTIMIADMNGDGLPDIVRVRHSGEIVYWANLGFGLFGPKVTMFNAPVLDTPQEFDPRYLQFADVSGTGAADLIYLKGGFRAWINLGGNAWGPEQPIDPFPHTALPARVSVMDLLGNGTGAIVWSSETPGHATSPLQFIDLMGGRKPYLLNVYRNNLGMETRIDYRSSTYYYLLDKQAGNPWVTRLPFPTQCVARVVVTDSVSGSHLVNEYRYRHGFYDSTEREFRGFGMTEVTDSESFARFAGSGARDVVDREVHQAPVRRRTWYHTGAHIDGVGVLRQFAGDYYRNAAIPEHMLADEPVDGDPLTPDELRQAARACKGMTLRSEVYADDETPLACEPYSTTESNYRVRMIQPALHQRHAVFAVHESESITHHYERDPTDPRVAHSFNTVIDDLGNVVESATVAYPREIADASLPQEVRDEQARVRITYAVKAFTNDVVKDAAYRTRRPWESRSYELTGSAPAARRYSSAEVRGVYLACTERDPSTVPGPGLERRLLRHERALFAKDADMNAPLAQSVLGSLGVLYETYRLAFTPTLLSALYAGRVTNAMLAEGKYVSSGGSWWIPSGTARYPANPDQHFFMPDRFLDPYGFTTKVRHYSNYHLLVDRVEDELGNATVVHKFDFRVLEPELIEDINGNLAEVRFDTLGLVVGTALRGKGAEADDLAGFNADLTPAQINVFYADPAGTAAGLLSHATSRFVYRLDTVPAFAASIVRETHYVDALASGVPSKVQLAFEYSDGLGHVAMRKVQAEPGFAKRSVINADGTYTISEENTTPALRWIGSGREIRNNKLKTVMAFEPYFSVTHAYETARELVESGVTPVLRYDPVDRLIRTDFPDGSFSRVEFDGWSQRTYDPNDNLLASDWYADRNGGALGAEEQDAAARAMPHDDTPATAHLDSMGRTVLTVDHNKYEHPETGVLTEELLSTRLELDIKGQRLAVHDPRGNVVMRYAYDVEGRKAHTTSMDAGERWAFSDCMEKPLYGWDNKANQLHTIYDGLHRPVARELANAAANIVYEQSIYGTSAALNECSRLIEQHDGAGIVTHAYDFKGNVVASRREFADKYDGVIDWTIPANVLLGLACTTTVVHDALNRVVSTTTDDGSITEPRYSEANLLTGVSVAVRGGARRSFIDRIDHDAKGQRQKIDYGNRTSTVFTYDPITFRIRSINTIRSTDGAMLQDLRYTCDPSGNITAIRDQAQQAVYFNNQVALAHSDFAYDALYRLIWATGREHIGQNKPVDRLDPLRSSRAHPADGTTMQNYRQYYEYDAAGNMTRMSHSAGRGMFAHQWTRDFEPDEATNRLTRSKVGAVVEDYTYDPHGNLTSVPGLPTLDWDFDNRLRKIDLGGGGTAYYVYDSDGQRVRKVIDRGTGTVEQRFYVGGREMYGQWLGGALQLRRDSLHVMDGVRRLALIDVKVSGIDNTPPELIRYQFSNHLETAVLELDDHAQVITYEEYYPYGSTSFQSVDSSREVPAKRYRYTEKERDEESGFYYHGARFFLPWTARWASADKIEIGDGLNRYMYVNGRPIHLSDPTGRYGEGGHYYTVYFASLAAGFDPKVAQRNAAFAQMPDEVNALDAVKQQLSQMKNTPGMVGWEESNRDIVQRGLHSLTGGLSSSERKTTRDALTRAQPGSLKFGLLLHRLGDTYAHSQRGNESRMYETGLGHFWQGHTPDQIQMRPELYKQYASDLFGALRETAAKQGLKARLSADQVAKFAAEVSSIRVVRTVVYHMRGERFETQVFDMEATEKAQIQRIRDLSEKLMGKTTQEESERVGPLTLDDLKVVGKLSSYKPESEDTVSWKEYKAAHPEFVGSISWAQVAESVFDAASEVGEKRPIYPLLPQ